VVTRAVYTAGTERQKKIATANVSEQFSSIRFIMYSSYHVWGMHQAGLYTPVVRIKKPATGCTCGRLLRTIAHEDFLQRDERVRIRMDFPLCRFDHVRIKE
jgi:hypothetical protein